MAFRVKIGCGRDERTVPKRRDRRHNRPIYANIMMNRVTIGSYWGSRKESRAQCAARCYRFLRSISSESSLQEWYELQRRRGGKLGEPLKITEPSIYDAWQPSFTEVGHRLIPELGFYFSKWNGNSKTGADLSVTCGMYFETYMGMSNAAVLTLHGQASFRIELYRKLLQASIDAWDPDHAAAITSIIVDTPEGIQTLEWLTYGRDEGGYKTGAPSSFG
jgi:hypothetical protein